MTYAKHSRPTLTAIAAVLAFATPAMAQDAATPVVELPVTTTPVTVTPDPVPVIEPAPDPTLIADELSPATSSAEPVVSTRATRANRTVDRARSTPRARTAVNLPRSNSAVPAPRLAAPVEGPAPEAIAPMIAPLAATPVEPLVETPAPGPAPQAASEMSAEDVLPIAGAAGLGLLALIGAGTVMRRRKRNDEDAEFGELGEPHFERPMMPPPFSEPVREPALASGAANVAPVTPAVTTANVGRKIDAPATKLPEGFDLSRFGPHVQAAYCGPTEDNPSLSLKNRLRRASAMDQMTRSDDPVAAAPALTAEMPATAPSDGAIVSKVKPAMASNGSFMLGGGANRPTVRPEYQN